MKNKKLLIIIPLMFLLVLGLASATIDWNNDVSSFIPLEDVNEVSQINWNGYGGVSTIYDSINDFSYANFDGVDDYIGADFSVPSGSLTYSVWVYKDSLNANYEAIMGVQNGANVGGRFLTYEGGNDKKILMQIISDEGTIFGIKSDDVLSINQWVHIVIVLDTQNNKFQMYIDNKKQIDEDDISGKSFTNVLSNFKIGKRPDTSSLYYNGKISRVSVFNKALTTTEISNLYSEGATSKKTNVATSNLVFEESFTQTNDLSGNGNNGYMMNGVTYDHTDNAFDFDGVDDYIDLNYKTQHTTYTLSAWVNTDSSSLDLPIISNSYRGSADNGLIVLDITADNKPQIAIYNDGWIYPTGSTILTDGQWYMVTATYDGTNLKIYLNGNLENSLSVSYSLLPEVDDWRIGQKKSGSSTQQFIGKINSPTIYDKALTSTEVSDLFAKGRNYNPYADGSSPAFSVTAKDLWSDSPINNFWATIDGVTYTTTNGTINTDLYQNDTNTYNLVVGADDYFTESYSNIAVDTNYESTLHQSEISFSSYEAITNNSISNCNYTINSVQDTTFYLNAGEHTVLVECPNYYAINHTFNVAALDQRTENIEGIYNLKLNITVSKKRDGTIINNFSGIINQTSNNYTTTFSTPNNISQVNIIKGLDYELKLNPVSGYATNYGLNKNLSATELTNNTYSTDFQIYENNSILFNFKNADTQAYITSDVNATLTDGTNSYNFSTSTGKYFLDNVAGSTYTLTSKTDGFNDVQVFVTVLNNNFQTLNVFFGGDVVPKEFVVVDNAGKPVAGVVVTFTKEVNGATVTYGQKITDFAGAIQIYLNEATLYTLTATKSGYKTFSGEVTPFQNTYTINIQEEGTEIFKSSFDDITYSQNTTDINNNTWVNTFFNIISPSGYLQFYGMNTSYNGTDYFQNVTGNPSGGIITFNITNINTSIDNDLVVTYWFKSVNSSLTSWDVVYLLDQNLGSNNLNSWDFSNIPSGVRAILGIIILIIGVGSGLILTRRAFVGAILGMFGLGFNMATKLWPMLYSTLALIVLIIVLISDLSSGENR